MRLVVVVLATVLALAPAAGAASATASERALVACANHLTRIGAGYAERGDGPVFVQDFGTKAGDSAR
jgi:hypothetical protein